jgi:anthraniloyl-CoA monooxygenase
VGLVARLDANNDVDAALAEYQAARQPSVAKIQGSARPSLSWWEHFGRSHDTLPPWQFAYHFFTRALTNERLGRRDPSFVAATEARWISEHGTSPLASALDVAGVVFESRVVIVDEDHVVAAGRQLPLRREPSDAGWWGLRVDAPAAETDLGPALELVAKGAAAGAALVAVFGGTSLTRRLLCEEARLGCSAATLLVLDELDADVALTEVLSGRADLVGSRSLDRL